MLCSNSRIRDAPPFRVADKPVDKPRGADNAGREEGTLTPETAAGMRGVAADRLRSAAEEPLAAAFPAFIPLDKARTCAHAVAALKIIQTKEKEIKKSFCIFIL